MGRYVWFCLFCWSWALVPSSAQQLSPPPGYVDTSAFRKRPVYFHNDRLRLTLESATDQLLVRSDVTGSVLKLAAQPYQTHDETRKPSYRRKCWLLFWQQKYRRVKRPQANAQTRFARNCDLGPFSRSGLHQVYITGPGKQPKILHLFAYSGWTGQPASSSELPALAADASRDALLQEATCLLTYGLAHAKKDKLLVKWDTLLTRQLADHRRKNHFPYSPKQQYVQKDFALVLAADNPLALFVTNNPVDNPGKQEADSLRLFARKFIKQALLSFGDTAFSTLRNEAGIPVALLPPAAINLIDEALTTGIDLGFDKPDSLALLRIDDGGFVQEELLIEGVKSEVLASAFRIRTVHQYFRQVEVLFRLRAPLAPQ